MNVIKDIEYKLFGKDISDRDRAIFECGISLGALFHQFTGMPLKKDKTSIATIEKAIQDSISAQPYIKSVKVAINPDRLKNGTTPYDYSILTGENFEVELVSQFGKVSVVSKLKYIKELDFPLMFIERIEEK